MLSGFSSETNYTVWNDVISNLSKLSVLLQYTPSDKLFKAFCIKLLTAVYENVGWEKQEGEGKNMGIFLHIIGLRCGIKIERLEMTVRV